jgi:hypothetical protein
LGFLAVGLAVVFLVVGLVAFVTALALGAGALAAGFFATAVFLATLVFEAVAVLAVFFVDAVLIRDLQRVV